MKGQAPLGVVVATYPYRDEHGVVLYETVRYHPKDFRQRRPHPTEAGRYVNNLAGVRFVLYRLPELLAADPKRPVFYVEGEKLADRLAADLDLVSTTNVLGAGKWRDDYAHTLRGRHVLVVPDHDPVDPTTGLRAGWEHAVRVANRVHGLAASVKVVRLPDLTEGQDMEDWLDGFPRPLDKAVVFGKLAGLVRTAGVWEPRPEREPPSAFLAGVGRRLALARQERSACAGTDEALGLLRKLYLRVEAVLSSARPDGVRLDRELTALAAACAWVVEGLTGSGPDSGAAAVTPVTPAAAGRDGDSSDDTGAGVAAASGAVPTPGVNGNGVHEGG